MKERYEPAAIEFKWQQEWERSNLYVTREDPGRPKFYVLEMFPYPSGDGLSVGHLHNYVPCDVIGRYKRMAGRKRRALKGPAPKGDRPPLRGQLQTSAETGGVRL